MQIPLDIGIRHVKTNPTAVKEHLPVSHTFSDSASSFCMYSPSTHKKHQEMNSTNNQLSLALLIIVYMVVLCYFFVKQKTQEKLKSYLFLIYHYTCHTH